MLKVGKIYYNGRYLDEYAELPEIGESWKHGQNSIINIKRIAGISADQYPRDIYELTITYNEDDYVFIERIAIRSEYDDD